MKSSLGKQLKRFALHKTDAKDKKDRQTLAHIEALALASQDMKDMRNCCDSLLSAAAATTNSAYEFSESLLEMGNCLLERTALDYNGECGECGKALSMLGKVQLELQKLVDSYRSHVIQTITNPSECLLSELRKVEEMKLQCDEKREMYKHMVIQHREKGKSKTEKGESFTSQELQAAREEYDEVARLCVFRVESLKQGQCRSLLTQAARHHAAQLIFFRRGLKSLEAVEPYVRIVSEKQHIDYQLNGLDDAEDGEDGGNSYDTNDDGELSFDNRQSKLEQENACTSRNSMELDQADAPSTQTSGLEDVEKSFWKKKGEQIFSWKPRVSSFSAPIYAEKFDQSEKIREIETPVQKFHAYALPTPDDAKSSTSRTSSSSLQLSATSVSGSTSNLWHSSPLDTQKPRKFMDDNLAARTVSKSQSIVKDSHNNPSVPLPSRIVGGISPPQYDTHNGYDAKKVKRQAFSGPLLSKPSSSKPLLSTSGPIGPTEVPQIVSGLLSKITSPQLPSNLNIPQSVSPPLASSPKISELHELPRPPGSLSSKPASSSVTGHSAPLINRNQDSSPTKNRSRLLASNAGSPLPPPPPTVPRSFSIPSRNHRAEVINVAKLLESPEIREQPEGVHSPPLTPISLSDMRSSAVVSELASNSGQNKR